MMALADIDPAVAAENSINIVTVTYGDRIHLLENLLAAVYTDRHVDAVYVVSNNASSDFSKLAVQWGGRLKFIELPANTGSANGFSIGIQDALSNGARRLLLMDDDNVPHTGSIATLIGALDRAEADLGVGNVLVSGLRIEHQKQIADGVPVDRVYPAPSTFMGFHVLDIPFKIWRRRPWRRTSDSVVATEIDVAYAPYGGLMGSRETFLALGLPRADFVLYGDDIEYTMRLTAAGGVVRLIVNAQIEDVEAAHGTQQGHQSVFSVLLRDGSKVRSYYTIRNRTWIDRNIFCASLFFYSLNKFVFIVMLKALARHHKQQEMLRVIIQAVSDGENNRLGLNPDFPLK